MKGILALTLCGVMVLFSQSLWAQNPVAVCLAMVNDAAHNVGVQTSSSSFLSTVYDNYCEQDGSTKQSSFNASLSAIVEEIPVGLTGGGNDASSQMTNFCKNYQSKYQASTTNFDFQSLVVQKALESANQCLEIATRTQSTVTYKVLTPQTLAINFGIPSGQTIDIRGISHENSVSCIGSKVTGAGTITYATGSGQSVNASAGTYSIACTRQPYATQAGNSFYNATGLIVDTNVGGVDIFWPQETVLPVTTASQLQGYITSLNTQLQHLQSTVDFNLLPVGTIVPWYEKNQSPPSGWAKCDGSDPRAPNLTDLFLRGTSSGNVGTSGGSDTHSHEVRSSNNSYPDGDGWSKDGGHFVGRSISGPNVPKYMAVLYIMKVANQ